MQAKTSIKNQTQYPMLIDSDLTAQRVEPGGTYVIDSTLDQNQNLMITLLRQNQRYLTGFVCFGTLAGVYMDRGWQAPNDQSIKLIADVNGVKHVQMNNGGSEVIPWNGFRNGGAIEVSFITV